MNRNDPISYAASFVAFLIKDLELCRTIKRVLVFGSVARGDFDDESDIDVFVHVDGTYDEKGIRDRLHLFEMTLEARRYTLEGLVNPISLHIGNLNEQEGLRSTIAASSVTLYGPSDISPSNLRPYALFELDMSDKDRAKKVRMWRTLYGYEQKVGDKTYRSPGLVNKAGGMKIGRGVFMVPANAMKELTDLLNREVVAYSVREIWIA